MSKQKASKQKQITKTLKQRNRELLLLNRVSQMFSSTLDLDAVLETILAEVHRLLDVVSTSFWLIELETNELTCRHTKGPAGDILTFRLAIGQGITGWVAERGQSVIIPDIYADKRFFKEAAKQTDSNIRSMISIPLQTKGKIIGVLNAVDTRKNKFTQDDLTLLEPIATAAAIAIENAQLFKQELEAKQTAEMVSAALAALNAVALTVNNSLDLYADMEKALDIVMHILKFEQGWLFIPENNNQQLRLVASIGLPPEFQKQDALTPINYCQCYKVFNTGKQQHFTEDNACLRLKHYTNQHPHLSTQHISLPILAKQKTVGVLNLGGANVVNLTHNDYTWLEAITHQLGNAIENATLYQNTLNKAERLTVLNRISTIISHSWQLNRVLPPLLSEVARVLEMDLGTVVLQTNPNQNKYKIRAIFGPWQSSTPLNKIAWHKLSLLTIIAKTGAPLLIPNPVEDKRLQLLTPLIAQENIKTMLLLPLIVQNQLSGFIQLHAINQKRIFEATEVELARTLANQAAVAIEKARLYEANVTRYEKELKLARQIQQNLLPRSTPQIPGLQIAGLCQPAYATGGDFYDYITLSNNQLGIVVGDVTGKSLPAAIVMALARNTIRSELINHTSPDIAMTIANQWLSKDIQQGIFVATVEAVIDPIKRYLWLVNAGQTATLMLRNGQTSYLLPDEASGFPLGIAANITYSQAKISLQTNDILLFYTDGIVEAQNIDHKMFGFERLENVMETIDPHNTPEQIINTLITTMQDFVGNAEQHDDITLVIVKIN